MSASQKYARLLAEFQAAQDAERAIPAAQARARQEAEDLGRRLVEEFDLPADGSPPSDSAAKKVWNEWIAAKQRAEGPWQARLDRAKRETAQRESAAAKFANEQYGALVAEKEAEVREAHAEVLDSIQRAISAIERLEGERGAVTALARYVSGFQAPGDLPPLNLDTLRMDLRNTLARGVPVPLPRSLFPPEEFERGAGGDVLHPAETQRRAEARATNGDG